MRSVRDMTICSVFLFLFVCSINSCSKEPELKGRLETRSGQKILTVWGSHYEMGYAQGYLLGGNFLEMFDYYLVDYYYGGVENYEIEVRPFVIDDCVDMKQTPYGEELEGLLDGFRQVSADSGWSTESEVLGREIDITDLYAAQFVPDFFYGFGASSLLCSSVSAWDDATSTDPEVNGGLVYCRILDWDNDELLVENTVIVVYQSEEDSEIGWVSFTYPFFIGCLSGISEDGICACYNLGNHNVLEDESGKFWPILWSIRQGMETDCNSDGSHTKDDVYASIKANPRVGTHIVHCAEPALQNASDPAFVIEANNTGIAIRYSADEPDIAPDHLIATNHLRKLYTPSSCSRYSTLLDNLSQDPAMTTQRAWELEDSVSTFISVMKILARPDKRDFWFVYGEDLMDPLEQAGYYELDKLF
ncbi:hypothetical protein JXM67_05540 [candidate division WOR-3 bacterium]|nr:hypothetical protein [candidate division WOR-3 bacterium]